MVVTQNLLYGYGRYFVHRKEMCALIPMKNCSLFLTRVRWLQGLVGTFISFLEIKFRQLKICSRVILHVISLAYCQKTDALVELLKHAPIVLYGFLNKIVDAQAYGFLTNLPSCIVMLLRYFLRLRIIYSSIRIVVVSISLYIIFGVRHEKNIQNIFLVFYTCVTHLKAIWKCHTPFGNTMVVAKKLARARF